MSGHSKWSTIKHKKAALDAKRGKAWSKRARDITVAAKHGGGIPENNPRLRMAIDKARADNMPNDTIDKAIKKGTGELEGASYEEVIYEGYGPSGVAIMCHALTDNRNRTAPEIKKIFEKYAGNLGSINSVAWMFRQKGVFVISTDGVDEDRLYEIAVEQGADDVTSSADVFEITCAPDAFQDVKAALTDGGIAVQSADLTMVADNLIVLDAAAARKVLRLMDALDEQDDVQNVSANFDIPDNVMAEIAASP